MITLEEFTFTLRTDRAGGWNDLRDRKNTDFILQFSYAKDQQCVLNEVYSEGGRKVFLKYACDFFFAVTLKICRIIIST